MGFFRDKSKSRVASELVPPREPRARRSPWTFFLVRRRGRGAKTDGKKAAAAAAGPEMSVILLGCDGAGKTKLSGALSGADVSTPKETCGFETTSAKRSGSAVHLWEIGGKKGIREIWPQYYSGVHAAIFVVDAADASRFEEARTLLHEAGLDGAMRGKPLLVLANKQDRPQAVGPAEIADVLRIHELELPYGPDDAGHARQCYVVPSCLDGTPKVAAGSELDRGLEWLVTQVQAEYDALQARVERDEAEKKEKAERKKAERKARLEAKRKAREEEEAAAAAAAAGAEAPTGGVDVGLPPAS